MEPKAIKSRITKHWFEFDGPLDGSEILRMQEAFELNASEQELEAIDVLLSPEYLAQFQRLMVGSPFVFDALCKTPSWLLELLSSLEKTAAHYVVPGLCTFGDEATTTIVFDSNLRRWRNCAMVNLIWRDLNRLCSTESLIRQLSLLAEEALNTALNFHYSDLVKEFGRPTDSDGVEQSFFIVALGKLGAWELNLSSDVDLMFAYPSQGQTEGCAKRLSNQEFFARLGQRIIKSLDAMTQDGFVFRVDMRLRPYGNSGALVSCFDALEDYYQTQGREWERFAMIKARVVATNGDSNTSAQLMQIFNRFTYRKYVDYSAIEALRDLKLRINREVARRGLKDNIKLGRGGIREVEFIVQAFQIIRGGKEAELQERRVLHLLPLLDQLHCLPAGVHKQLAEAYIFLRNVEHAIQAQNDEQTQDLPKSTGHQNRLAFALGFADYPALLAVLETYREQISEQFQAVVAEPNDNSSGLPPGDSSGGKNTLSDAPYLAMRPVWQELMANPEQGAAILSQAESVEADGVAPLLQELIKSPRLVSMDAAGRARLDTFMPRLLDALQGAQKPAIAMARLVDLIKAVVRRSASLVLLRQKPGVLQQSIAFVEASPWVAQQLASHPALLDELLDPATLYHVPSKAELTQELQQALLRTPMDDLESQMEGLRYFRSAHGLRVAACEITDRLPLMRVSDYLTELAEVLLSYVYELAWQLMIAEYGAPGDATGKAASELRNFAVIGYGKMGGIELGHGSDLDLVFIHDASSQGVTAGNAEGKRSIESSTFYARLGQKIIHILNAQTLGGQLYEVDMRLRPSGNSGLLVSSITAFERYQLEGAWTWEHQALVRARVIVGDTGLGQRITALRAKVLQQARDPDALQKDVVDMRQKMRQQLGSSAKQQADGVFDLKQDAGGIVDIEFMVQYAVLAWSPAIPALAHYTDNIRILGCLEDAGQLQTSEVNQLIEAYKAFRSMGHRLALQKQSATISSSLFETERNNVKAIWARLFGGA